MGSPFTGPSRISRTQRIGQKRPLVKALAETLRYELREPASDSGLAGKDVRPSTQKPGTAPCVTVLTSAETPLTKVSTMMSAMKK